MMNVKKIDLTPRLLILRPLRFAPFAAFLKTVFAMLNQSYQKDQKDQKDQINQTNQIVLTNNPFSIKLSLISNRYCSGEHLKFVNKIRTLGRLQMDV